MKYTYTLSLYNSVPLSRSRHICTRSEEVTNEIKRKNPTSFKVEVYDNIANETIAMFETLDEWNGFLDAIARSETWDPFSSKETDIAMKRGAEEVAGTDKVHLTLGELKGEKKPDAVNPAHHKSFMKGEFKGEEVLFQWLEAQQFMPRFRNPESLKAAVELQVRKYLDRNGGKDPELQELQKALWYLKFLVAYIKNGDKPIAVADIEKILAS